MALLALVIGVLGALTPVAEAELTASGNLFVTFSGGIIPGTLPRHARAPIAVWISGKVRTLAGARTPALRTITIALNRNGYLDTQGLPTCRVGRISDVSSAEALAACRPALVGSGSYRARTSFPEQAPVPTYGGILAFNSTSGGHPVILAQVYIRHPVPSTNIIVFQIRRRTAGPYRTVLAGSVPTHLARWSYLKRIRLYLHRTYTYRGRRHSYLSAACPAPEDLKEASFHFAHTSMTFADGRKLSATLTRTCRAR